ncbi:nicotinate (nicotinamide) nucleotide adenylyltransferase [Christiangramia forsetii]|uniref:Probable nicotinate-nucleotide adenylyltransferase n=2 Tax=Christiangramia forsetii TaxID=411153 RepID=NADD_CHRFK|nr:nicotinate (nicotinamide) nucleotide adenylyltransferase [Christiangramia forsetii]A0M6X6.1 RecName: Full=Probable nicotinate-nucleotide adenylyltransferase; AltName: Full=Deamido-NAD(+) diphosphorylase; AltName: Full=Deamido-NAD(+) pyrophosphorylase; AltName: Full=Nicotinate mononucleotide adenylyltransferase; Short=NaMN adenylyltransferase [Christiangramia forsetii KT0803]GGG29261.1 putative nicotinate-nucleotide adenylyltransferase [Christiangramia forsetii]CAL68371.1 nicotinate-nucleotide
MNRKVGLFFGTFNPIHTGHLIIANHMAEYSDLEEIWLVVTPHNPHKKKSSLLDNHHRLEMVYRACEGYGKLKPSNIEFDLPQPNYTVNTLAHIQEKFPTNDFCLIMGEDNLKSFHKWKNSEVIIENHEIYVYPRIAPGKVADEFKTHAKITRVAAPIIEISSTFIRKSIKESKNIGPLLDEKVWKYIDEMNFYK